MDGKRALRRAYDRRMKARTRRVSEALVLPTLVASRSAEGGRVRFHSL
jgi:hypothetical protein